MPMDKSRYPQNWDEIATEVKERANWACQQCGLKHGEYIERTPGKKIKIVMTVHHVGAPKPDGTPGDRHDKMDCRIENLLCLCQRCHWLADIDIHIEKAQLAIKKRRIERIKQTGQLSLWENSL